MFRAGQFASVWRCRKITGPADPDGPIRQLFNIKSSMKKIIGLGAEGHAAVLIELIERAGIYDIEGLVNDDDSIKVPTMRGIPVVPGSEFLPERISQGAIGHFFMGLSSLKARAKRRSLFNYALECGLEPCTIIHPRAVISNSAQVGRGTCVLAGAIVSTQSCLRENVTVNIGAMIESDCHIEAHAQLGAGCYIGCGAHIGEGAYIGNGVYVQPNVRIGQDVTIGPGAVVAEDVADGQVVPDMRCDLPPLNRTKTSPVKVGRR